MGPTDAADDGPLDAQARARQGLDHLQAAARELIQAARAALDVAEEVVNDPEAIATLASNFATFGDVARKFTGTGGWPTPGARPDEGGAQADHPPGDDAPRVQRITVTS